MGKIVFLVPVMFLAVSNASAAGMFTSIEDRVSAVKASVKGNHSYSAHMARELSDVAQEEKYQNDTGVAKAFMTEAERYANQAEGK